MIRFIPEGQKKNLPIIVFAFIWLALVSYGPALAYDSPGLSLNIYVDQGDEDLTYDLADPDDPVTILMVIKNISSRAVDTERGFSQEELYHSLIVTDPKGAKYLLRPVNKSHKMPLPFFINEKAWSLSEKLPAGWVKSAKVNDLRTYIPAMSDTAGWYTIEAQMPFARFAVTGQFSSLGLMGVQENANNWNGIVSSKKLQIYIKPPGGAQFDVQVYDNSTDPPEQPFHVPVRVFKAEDVAGYTVEEKWNNLEYLLEGFTDEEGKVTLTTGGGCFSQDNYTIIAKYADEYQETAVDSNDGNWVPGGCGGSIAKVIAFTGAPEPPPDKVIDISGIAYNYPESVPYTASISINVNTESSNPSGLLKYYYVRTRMYFVSTEVNEVSASGTSATITGAGTVNRIGGYTFEANVVDGDPDSFGILIKDPAGNIYFNANSKEISRGDLQVSVQ